MQHRATCGEIFQRLSFLLGLHPLLLKHFPHLTLPLLSCLCVLIFHCLFLKLKLPIVLTQASSVLSSCFSDCLGDSQVPDACLGFVFFFSFFLFFLSSRVSSNSLGIFELKICKVELMFNLCKTCFSIWVHSLSSTSIHLFLS